MAGFGSLLEVKRAWDIDALADSHELLDLREAAERKAAADARQKQERW